MLKKINYIILLLIIMIIVCIIYYALNNNEAIKTYEIENKSSVYDNIPKEINDDVIGSLNISGIDLNTSLVQGLDNEYYLKHDINKKESKFGAIFLDYQSDLNNSNISYIYGHSSNVYELPFNKLIKYLDEVFLDSNNLIKINYLGDDIEYNIVEAYTGTSLKKLDKLHNYVVLQTCNQREKGNFIYIVAQKIF